MILIRYVKGEMDALMEQRMKLKAASKSQEQIARCSSLPRCRNKFPAADRLSTCVNATNGLHYCKGDCSSPSAFVADIDCREY